MWEKTAAAPRQRLHLLHFSAFFTSWNLTTLQHICHVKKREKKTLLSMIDFGLTNKRHWICHFQTDNVLITIKGIKGKGTVVRYWCMD